MPRGRMPRQPARTGRQEGARVEQSRVERAPSPASRTKFGKVQAVSESWRLLFVAVSYEALN